MPTPNLGYGTRGDAPIDTFNQWFRSQPQYAAKLASWGQSPDNVHLNDGQKQEMVRLAQSMGAVVDEGHNGQEVDDSGNFKAKSHTVRNIAIIGGIAAAALLTAGAAGAFAGPAAGGAAAGGGAAAAGAGTLAASTTVPLVGSLATGGAGLAATAGGAATMAAAASAVPWSTIIQTGTGLFGSLFGAHEQASAASDNADKQAAAAKYAADQQDAASKRSEALLRQQSEADYQNQEVARRGNYDQYRAQRSRLGTLGAMLGLPAPEIPDYVPSVDPRFTSDGTQPPSTSAPSSGAPAGAPAAGGSDAVTQALLDNYKALGVEPTGPGSGPTDIAYFAKQAKDALASGERPLSYWLGPQGRVAQELAKAKGGTGTSTAPIVPRGTLSTAAQPYQVASPTAPLTPYGTLAQYGA